MDGSAVAVISRYAWNVSNDKSPMGEKKKKKEHFARLQGPKLNCIGLFQKSLQCSRYWLIVVFFIPDIPGLKSTTFRVSRSRFYVRSVS
jgi:hypothetical protein